MTIPPWQSLCLLVIHRTWEWWIVVHISSSQTLHCLANKLFGHLLWSLPNVVDIDFNYSSSPSSTKTSIVELSSFSLLPSRILRRQNWIGKVKFGQGILEVRFFTLCYSLPFCMYGPNFFSHMEFKFLSHLQAWVECFVVATLLCIVFSFSRT